MLCNVKNRSWHIGTGSIRAEACLATGFRFVNWVHDGSCSETRAAPPPVAASTVYRQIEQWLPIPDRETESVLALTTRTLSAQHLQGFFKQSGRRANFLSGTSRSTDFDHECYTRANVAYSRATDLTISVCPVNMHGTTGVSQVLSALLHGVCTVYTNDQQTSKAFVEGDFPVKWKWVSESTADFLAAVEPQPLWTGLLPVCLVEYHQGFSRRLRLILTSQTHLTKGERALLDEQHPVHGKIHHSGLLFGYAADRSTEPDWYVLPDGHQPKAWKLLHAARKGGDRFCVGSGPRYAAQAGDAANKARDYQFESPRPGLLQNGCYWRPTPERVDSATGTQNAQVSLTETSSAESEETSPPSEVPEPASPGQATESPTSPIMIGSTEEEQVGSETNAAEASAEPSADASPIETVVSVSDNDAAQAKRTAPTLTSPAVASVANAAGRRDLIEGAQAGETESSTTDEIIDLEASLSTEVFQAHPASSSDDANTMRASQTAPHGQPPTRQLPAVRETTVIKEADKTKSPASPVLAGHTEGRRDTSARARTTGKPQLEGNSATRVAAPLCLLLKQAPLTSREKTQQMDDELANE